MDSEAVVLEYLQKHLEDIIADCGERLRLAEVEPYTEWPVEKTISFLRPSMQLDLDYLGSGDMTEWREYHENVIAQLYNKGRLFTSMVETGKIIGTSFEEFVKNQLLTFLTSQGIASEKIIAKLLRRAGNLQAAALSLTATHGLQKTV